MTITRKHITYTTAKLNPSYDRLLLPLHRPHRARGVLHTSTLQRGFAFDLLPFHSSKSFLFNSEHACVVSQAVRKRERARVVSRRGLAGCLAASLSVCRKSCLKQNKCYFVCGICQFVCWVYGYTGTTPLHTHTHKTFYHTKATRAPDPTAYNLSHFTATSAAFFGRNWPRQHGGTTCYAIHGEQ